MFTLRTSLCIEHIFIVKKTTICLSQGIDCNRFSKDDNYAKADGISQAKIAKISIALSALVQGISILN